MSENQAQRAWEERVVLPDKGSRIVHYIMHDTAGRSLLAVVGTERSARHMTFSVSADFLRFFGSTSTINAQTRWLARHEVVEWLRSLVANKGLIFANPSQQIIQTTPSSKHNMSLMARLSNRKSPMEGEGSRNLAIEKSDIVWSGDSWICNKQLKHYPAFCRSGITISVYSFVYVMGEGEKEYIAYVQDLYEDQHAKKMVKVRWFNICKDIKDLLSNVETHDREVLMTAHEQEISVECIDGVAAVLTQNHFEKCLKLLPQFMCAENFVCYREVRNKRIGPFCLSQLPGYSAQPVLASLINHVKSKKEGEIIITRPTEQQPKIKLSSKGAVDPNFAVPEPQYRLLFKVNENIEVLSQDSGMRGCWFRCKILHVSQKRIKVQYHDVLDVDGPEKLEEWVPSQKVAEPDKLGMRLAGRLTVRPWPTDSISECSSSFDVGAAVDAWWNDGWWEGVMIGYASSQSNLQVFFPGENKFLTIERKNVRVSKEWINGKWMNVKPKPDILSFITSILNPTPKLPPRSVLAGTSSAAPVNSDILSIPRPDKAAELKAVEELNLKKRLVIRVREDQAGRD